MYTDRTSHYGHSAALYCIVLYPRQSLCPSANDIYKKEPRICFNVMEPWKLNCHFGEHESIKVQSPNTTRRPNKSLIFLVFKLLLACHLIGKLNLITNKSIV